MQIQGTRDIKMIDRLLRHPDWVMPENVHTWLPEQMAAVVTRAEHLAGGQADPKRHFCAHRMLVGLAADAVGAEVLALAHGLFRNGWIRRVTPLPVSEC